MKKLWNLLSFLAVVNLLVLGMLVAWLRQTDRLDRDRLYQARELFSRTLTEVAEAEAAAAAGADAPERSTSAVTSAAHTRQISRVSERELLAMQRLEDEQRMLREQLDDAAVALAEKDEAVRADRASLSRERADDRAATGDAQFAKAVRHLESLPPKQGKAILMELVGRGEQDRAVEYLDAMAARPAGKVLKEFKTADEARVATELLERLGRLGLETGFETAPAKDPDDAHRSAQPPAAPRGPQDDQGPAASGAGAREPRAGAL